MEEPLPLNLSDSARPALCSRCAAALASEANFCPKCGLDQRGVSPASDTYRGFLPGKVIDGRYKLMERLGEGGMGAVFKVEHVRMGKVMALKLLRREFIKEAKVLERFRDEARIVSKLSHPNTISVFDFGEQEGGEGLYIAMEYVHGQDLAHILEEQKVLPERRAASLGVQVLRSLEEAHEAGIIHRDIKPANVMVIRTRAGEDWVKVVDFGIAKLAGAALEQHHEARKKVTGVAEFVGTPDYCSPEQARGHDLDARSDLYSLSAMLFELVTGKGPYEGSSPLMVVAAHLSDPVPSARLRNADISEAFDHLLIKGMAKNPDDRFQSAEEMRKALEAVAGSPIQRSYSLPEGVTGEMAIASREDWDSVERTLARSSSMRVWLGALLMISVIGGAGYAAWRRVSAPVVAVAVTEEREPNDDPQDANLIALDTDVSGAIGVSHKAGKSDIDTFLLEIPRQGQLWVSLTGVPDLNLVLEAFDGDRTARHEDDAFTHITSDDGRLGEGELLSDYPVHPGRYYLRVSERPAYDEPDPSRPPRERASVSYHLRAHLVDGTPFDEREPNDGPTVAQTVTFEQPVLGHAGLPVPNHVIERDLVLGGLDYFQASVPGGVRSVAAFLAQPAGRTLGITDTADIRHWTTAAAAFYVKKAELEKKGTEESKREIKKLSAPFLVAPGRPGAQGVAVVRLGINEGQAGVLVESLEGPPPAIDDAPYGLALAHGGAGGLDAVLALGAELARQGRGPQAKALLQRAAEQFPDSPDLSRVQAAISANP